MATKYLRKVIKISAKDSPNVQVALEQEARGQQPTMEVVLPGVLSYELYKHRRLTWDPVRQCISLDGEFYEGAQVLLYPPAWLDAAEAYARTQPRRRAGEAMGVDTAEGGDSTCWCVVDAKGIINLISMKTPDTSIITGRTIALMREYGVNPKKVYFDQGGGGQEHADRLRSQGYPVQDVSFGEGVAPEPVRHLKPFDEKKHDRREKFTYRNRRSQMYWLLRLRLDPGAPDEEGEAYPWFKGQPFGIPEEYQELRRQLSIMPLLYDEEGRVEMLPKRRTARMAEDRQTLEDILGRSPDEADSLALAVYAMDPVSKPRTIQPIQL